MNFVYVALGGAAGAVLRFVVTNLSQKYIGGNFPWGTLAVNLLGSFLIGLLWGLYQEKVFSANFYLLGVTGMMGAFTTFSTFSLENLHLFRTEQVQLALANILVSNLGGLVLVGLGFGLARLVLRN